MLFSGDVERAIESAQSTLERMDRIFAENPGVPRYFNSPMRNASSTTA